MTTAGKHFKVTYMNDENSEVYQYFETRKRAEAWCNHIGREDLILEIERLPGKLYAPGDNK